MSTATRLSFRIKASPTTTIPIQISDPSNLQAENLPLETWGSAEVLANQLHKLHITLPTADEAHVLPVLELGAGTGIAGLTAASVWHTTSVLTDLPPILPGIEANVRLNEELLQSQSGRAFSGTLDWADPTVLRLGGQEQVSSWSKAQILLAADTVYDEDHPALLCNAITAWLAPNSESRFIACYPLRVGYLDHIRDLWERLEASGMCCVEEGREMAPPEWEEETPYEWCSWAWKKT